ncbi:MAG: hypothetical protein M3418_11365 [Gemmatimonadota bacterium]|nr:hypothetical protein [Gemmatimonadota bacterium]
MSEVQLPFPELALPPMASVGTGRLLRLAVSCPECGARPALRITEAAAQAVAEEPPEKRLGTYQCHRRRCGRVYDLTAAAYQTAL